VEQRYIKYRTVTFYLYDDDDDDNDDDDDFSTTTFARQHTSKLYSTTKFGSELKKHRLSVMHFEVECAA